MGIRKCYFHSMGILMVFQTKHGQAGCIFSQLSSILSRETTLLFFTAPAGPKGCAASQKNLPSPRNGLLSTEKKRAWEVTQITDVFVRQWKRSKKHQWKSYENIYVSKSKPRIMGQEGPPSTLFSKSRPLVSAVAVPMNPFWQVLSDSSCTQQSYWDTVWTVTHFMVTNPMLFMDQFL